MRINWFSPIEPARTGIAQYSNMIVPWLARHAEVCVWTTQQHYDATILKHAEVRQYAVQELPWPDLNRADLTFFHMGNNVAFHLDIWLAAMRYPGIVVLHDAFYPDFFNGVRDKLQAGSIPRRLGIAERLQQATAGQNNRYALLQVMLEKSTAALLHSPAEFEGVAGALHCPSILRALPYEPASAETFREWTKLRGGKRERRRIIVFGYLNSNRRVPSILEVLAKYRSRFELQLCGQLSDVRPIEEKIRELALQDTVTVTGYLDDLDRALAQADLAINLRNPTMGEASGSQLKIWDHALPAIVSRIGWYAHLPEDTVFFVRPDAEQEDLSAHLESYLADPERHAAVGAKGRLALLANHSPDMYAQSLTGLAERHRVFHSAAAGLALGTRVGEDMKRWFDRKLEGFTEKVAEQIGDVFG